MLATVEREEKQSKAEQSRAEQGRAGQNRLKQQTYLPGIVVGGFGVVEWNDCAGVRFYSVWVPRRGDWLSAAFSRVVTLFSCVEGWNPMPGGSMYIYMYIPICTYMLSTGWSNNQVVGCLPKSLGVFTDVSVKFRVTYRVISYVHIYNPSPTCLGFSRHQMPV